MPFVHTITEKDTLSTAFAKVLDAIGYYDAFSPGSKNDLVLQASQERQSANYKVGHVVGQLAADLKEMTQSAGIECIVTKSWTREYLSFNPDSLTIDKLKILDQELGKRISEKEVSLKEALIKKTVDAVTSTLEESRKYDGAPKNDGDTVTLLKLLDQELKTGTEMEKALTHLRTALHNSPTGTILLAEGKQEVLRRVAESLGVDISEKPDPASGPRSAMDYASERSGTISR